MVVEQTMTKELIITSDAPGEKLFMLGNEAMARGAIEAGVQIAAAYPGTPSSEILGTLAEVSKDVGMYTEWSSNEKVALEVAFAASRCGLRGMAVMKQVGVNVALDSLKYTKYKGARGGFVVIAADEPDLHGHQGAEDTRNIGQREYIPILEPFSVQEAKDMVVDAFRLSEEFGHPFIIRTVTKVGHARSDVLLGEIAKEKRVGSYIKDPAPSIGDTREQPLLLERFNRIKQAVNKIPYNELKIASGAKLGIIACGLSYSYTLEALGNLELAGKVSVLKIGTPYPLPEELVKKLLNSVEEVLVVEELFPFVELHTKAIAGEYNIPVKFHGKDLTGFWELSHRIVTEAIAGLTGAKPPINYSELDKLSQEVAPFLPMRPPFLCAGCPHRASLYAITIASRRVAKEYGDDVDPIYPTDIGCYTLGRFPPLCAGDEGVAMGGSIGIACGFVHAVDAPIVPVIGDSTFFHTGLPALVNAVFNKANITMVVMDNGATAMTGFQPHPGTGVTATGQETIAIKMEDIARACGVRFVEIIDPFDDLKKAVDTFEKAIRFEGPSVVVSRSTCAQLLRRDREIRGEEIIPYHVDQEECSKCLSDKKRLFPCKAACPACNDVKGFLDLVREGKFEEGFDLIKETNPLPAVLGRVCYHPCESECNRCHFDEAVAVHNVERFLGDYGLSLTRKKKVAVKKEERVAIIGSGPAGLSCAYYLATMGYGVTVFEALPVAGGMLAIGIPNYRLPKEILKEEIKAIEDLGIEIRTNTRISSEDNLLEQGYKAVFVAVGTHKSMPLGVTGQEKQGVVPALSFLSEINQGKPTSIGDRIIIVGGGNVAIDAARVSLRQGARQVSIIYRRSREEMPASNEEIEAAEEEGIKITYLAAPTKVLGENKVTGLECIRIKLGGPDDTGRARPIPIEGSEFTLDADTIISAIGQTPDLSFTNHELDITDNGTLIADVNTMATNKPGIFSGGDAVTGPATVTEAIMAGRKASLSIDRYISGVPLETYEEEQQVPLVKFEDLNLTFTWPAPREKINTLPVADRTKGFAEINGSLTQEAAIVEAQRCLSCCVEGEKCITSLGCPAIIREDGKTIIDQLQCTACGLCTQICPYNAIVQEQKK